MKYTNIKGGKREHDRYKSLREDANQMYELLKKHNLNCNLTNLKSGILTNKIKDDKCHIEDSGYLSELPSYEATDYKPSIQKKENHTSVKEKDTSIFGPKLKTRKPNQKELLKQINQENEPCVWDNQTMGKCNKTEDGMTLFCYDEKDGKEYSFDKELNTYNTEGKNEVNAVCKKPSSLLRPTPDKPKQKTQLTNAERYGPYYILRSTPETPKKTYETNTPVYKTKKSGQSNEGQFCLSTSNCKEGLVCENEKCINSSGGKNNKSKKNYYKKNKRGGNSSLKLNLPQGPNMDCGSPFHPRWGSNNSMSKLNSLPNMNGYTFHQEGNLGFIKGGKNNNNNKSKKNYKKNKKGGNSSLKLNLPQGPNMDCGSPFHPRWGSANSMSKLNSLSNMNGYTFHQEGNLGFIKGGNKWSKHVGKTLKKNKNMKFSKVLSVAKKTYKK